MSSERTAERAGRAVDGAANRGRRTSRWLRRLLPEVRGAQAEVEQALAFIYVVLRAVQTVQLLVILAAGDPTDAGAPAGAAAACAALLCAEFAWVVTRTRTAGGYGGRATFAVEFVTVNGSVALLLLATPESADRLAAGLWLFSPTIVMVCAYGLFLRPSRAVLAALPTPALITGLSGVHPVSGQGLATTAGYLTAYPVLTLGVTALVRYLRSLGERLQVSEEQVAEQARREEQDRSNAYLHDRVVNRVELAVADLRAEPALAGAAATALSELSSTVRDLRETMNRRSAVLHVSVDELVRSVGEVAVRRGIHDVWPVLAVEGLDPEADGPALGVLGTALREVLINASKHGRAREATIRLKSGSCFLGAHVSVVQSPGTAAGLERLDPARNEAFALVLASGGTVEPLAGEDAAHVEIRLPRASQRRAAS